MDFLLEILFELLIEGTFFFSKNIKVPKIIRYPLILLIILFFLSVIIIIFYTGILAYQKINKICGIILIIIGVIFLITSIVKFKEIYVMKIDDN